MNLVAVPEKITLFYENFTKKTLVHFSHFLNNPLESAISKLCKSLNFKDFAKY